MPMDDSSPCTRVPVDPIIKQLMIIRQSRGYRQSYVASRMRSTQTAISEMERGFVSPKLWRVRGYAQAVGLDIYLGGQGHFPDFEAMDMADLVDLYQLVSHEVQRRISCPMTMETVDAS